MRCGASSVSISRRLSFRIAVASSRLAAALSFTVAALVLAGPAQAGIAGQVGATFGLMLPDVVTAVPALEGLVVQGDGENLYLDLGRKGCGLLGQAVTVV